MKIAKEQSAYSSSINLVTTQFEEDKSVIPAHFNVLPNLERSVLNVGTFSKPRKLPFIGDILQVAYENCDSEYIIYTNTDIILMPFFYDVVFEIIAAGHDAFAINRRRISKKFFHATSLASIFAEVGKSHPGFDCFVFKRDLIPHFVFENICVGVPFIEASFIYNLNAFSNNFKLFYDKHLTAHIGMQVMPQQNPEYYRHNRNEFFKKVLPQIKPRLKANNLPYAELPFLKRMLTMGLTRHYLPCSIPNWKPKAL